MHVQFIRFIPVSFHVLIVIAIGAAVAPAAFAQPADVAVPDDFPRFVVPGKAPEMDALRKLFWVHYKPAGPLIPLWDEWMAISTLWPARGEARRWMRCTSDGRRRSRDDGSTRRGTFPRNNTMAPPTPRVGRFHAGWMQAGIGWHFRGTGIAGYDAPLATQDNWTIENATTSRSDRWAGSSTSINPMLSSPRPLFRSTRAAHRGFVSTGGRADWEMQSAIVEWTSKQHPNFDVSRRVYFNPADVRTRQRESADDDSAVSHRPRRPDDHPTSASASRTEAAAT